MYRLAAHDFKEYGGVYKMKAAGQMQSKDTGHYQTLMDAEHVKLLGRSSIALF